MSLDPTDEVRPNFQKNAPQRPQRTIFGPRWRLTSSRELTLRRHGFPDHVIEGTLDLHPAPNGRCRTNHLMTPLFWPQAAAGRSMTMIESDTAPHSSQHEQPATRPTVRAEPNASPLNS